MKVDLNTLQKVMKPLLKANGFKVEKKEHNATMNKYIWTVKEPNTERQAVIREIIKTVVPLLGDRFVIERDGDVLFDGIRVFNFWSCESQFRIYNY